MKTMTHDTGLGAAGLRAAGLSLALLSASSFALSGPMARSLMEAGWTPAAAVAARILVGAAVLAPLAVLQLRGRWRQTRRHLPLVLLYGLVPVAGTQLAYFNAVARMPVAVALLIEYTAPLAVVAWLWLRHRQRPAAATVVGAAVGTVGLLLVLGIGSGVDMNAVGVAWGLAAMLGAAFYFVLSSRTDDGLPGSVLAAGGLLVGGVVLLVAGTAGIVPFTASTAAVGFASHLVPWWALVLAFGAVTAALSYAAGIAAARRLGARLASFVALSEVVAAVLFAWLLLGEVPRPGQLLGGVLILVGVVAVKLGEPVTAPEPGPGRLDRDRRPAQPARR
jgi:drug/metabolite transporter (DMT)-like permease